MSTPSSRDLCGVGDAGADAGGAAQLEALDVAQPVGDLDGRRVVEAEGQELVVGRLGRDPGAQQAGVVGEQLEEHLAGVADTEVEQVVGVDGGMPGDVAEDRDLVLVLQRCAVEQPHALPHVGVQRAAVVVPELDLGAVAGPGAGIPRVEEHVGHVAEAVHPVVQPRHPAATVAVGDQDERVRARAVRQAQGVRIFIGAETRLFSLSGSALIAAPYMSGRQKVLGAIGVIGPARLNYARVIPLVDYTARVLGKMMDG